MSYILNSISALASSAISFIRDIRRKSVFITDNILLKFRFGSIYIYDPAIDNEFRIDTKLAIDFERKILDFYRTKNQQILYFGNLHIKIEYLESEKIRIEYFGYWGKEVDYENKIEVLRKLNSFRRAVKRNKN